MRHGDEGDGGIEPFGVVTKRKRGLGPMSAGQSGDTQGLSDVEDVGGDSVESLAEEGQYFEAEIIGGVEEAADRGPAEVRTRQIAEDDIPLEYLGRD
jgi:hypothetical protein